MCHCRVARPMSQSVEGGQVDSAVFRTLFPGIHNLAQWSQTAALQHCSNKSALWRHCQLPSSQATKQLQEKRNVGCRSAQAPSHHLPSPATPASVKIHSQSLVTPPGHHQHQRPLVTGARSQSLADTRTTHRPLGAGSQVLETRC